MESNIELSVITELYVPEHSRAGCNPGSWIEDYQDQGDFE
jgi:hypothetical protein